MFLVIIAVLLIAVIENPVNPWLASDAVITNPGTNEMQITIKKGREMKQHKSAGEEGRARKPAPPTCSKRRHDGLRPRRRQTMNAVHLDWRDGPPVPVSAAASPMMRVVSVALHAAVVLWPVASARCERDHHRHVRRTQAGVRCGHSADDRRC